MVHSPLFRAEPSVENKLENDATILGYDKPLPTAFGFNEGRGSLYEEEDPDERPPVKPLVELEMTQLSAELRRKPSWWTKRRDETILSKWREEALAQAKLMKESHIDYVLEELAGYANYCHDKIWQSDTLIPTVLKEQLVCGVAKLEDVLDLVHPSLYPIVYGRTLSYPEDSDDRSPTELQLRLKSPEEKDSRLSKSGDYYISKRFQWLPIDFEVSEDGASVRSLSHVNNLDPVKHQALCKAIEGLIAAYIPLFERVLTDSIPRIKRSRKEPITALHGQKFDEDHEGWGKSRIVITPRIPEGGYPIGNLENRRIKYKLSGRTIQVIVKLANIYLCSKRDVTCQTPEKPEYSGGSWHVEGMKNEAIAASEICYYDEENITESRLAFRTAVAPPYKYEQDDNRGCMLTWGMKSIAYLPLSLWTGPNLDTERLWRCFWLILLFVNHPQLQYHRNSQNDSMVEGTMTREEAEAYRLKLMDERSAFVATNDEEFFMVPFALCER
ncbi:hypothetical protein B0J17DRAFT_629848 [Rhizoctonia solani]|nr:hypothetical protein B0J17DRAFT_629848 [Rhizoctonia solani]